MARARDAVADGEDRPLLHTERLDIVPFVPFTLPLIEVALRSRAALQQALGAQVPAEWLTEDGDEILLLLAEGLRAHPAAQPWGWWLIVQRAERALVGDVSFRAPPDRSGTVEIGYGVDVAFQGRVPGPRLCDRGGRGGAGVGARAAGGALGGRVMPGR